MREFAERGDPDGSTFTSTADTRRERRVAHPEAAHGPLFASFSEPDRAAEKAFTAPAIVLGPTADKARFRKTTSTASRPGPWTIRSRPWAGSASPRARTCPAEAGVNRLCEEIGDRIDGFLTRPIGGEWHAPSRSNRRRHDGTSLERRHRPSGPSGRPDRQRRRHHRGRRAHSLSADRRAVVCRAVDGRRDVLGMAIGPSEAFRTALPHAIWCGVASRA